MIIIIITDLTYSLVSGRTHQNLLENILYSLFQGENITKIDTIIIYK